MASLRAVTKGDPAGPIATPSTRNEVVGNRLTAIGPVIWTGAPMISAAFDSISGR